MHLDASGQSERVADAVQATLIDTDNEITDVAEDEAMTHRSLELLSSRRDDAYQAALAELREDTQGWGADVLARDPDDIDEHEEPLLRMSMVSAAFSKTRCCRGFENR